MGTSLRAAAALLALAFAVAQVVGQNVPSDYYLLDPTNSTGNVSTTCVTRQDTLQCPDPAILFYLYSGSSGEHELMNLTDPEWFKGSKYDPALPTVLLVHGYRGGDSLVPLVVLKNAYIKLGGHNLIMMDWGALTKVPCYVQSVANLKAVSKCAAHMLGYLDGAGVDVEKVTCVGHSLGAHVCGIIANYATKKMGKIVALDPSRPLMTGRVASGRLDAKDAKVVQVLHSNTGFYALSGLVGTADFCINNGAQPYCERTRNNQLCSHLHAVCYFAESLHRSRARTGAPCGTRCPQRIALPTLGPNSQRSEDVTMGAYMDDSASGMYCLFNPDPPFCKNATLDPDYGDHRCCPVYPTEPLGTTTEPSLMNLNFALLPAGK